jgi:hypothetical protein
MVSVRRSDIFFVSAKMLTSFEKAKKGFSCLLNASDKKPLKFGKGPGYYIAGFFFRAELY